MQLRLLHDALEGHPVHGEDVLHLLHREIAQVRLGLDLGQIHQALVGELLGAAAAHSGRRGAGEMVGSLEQSMAFRSLTFIITNGNEVSKSM